jgi:hypothetical protein
MLCVRSTAERLAKTAFRPNRANNCFEPLGDRHDVRADLAALDATPGRTSPYPDSRHEPVQARPEIAGDSTAERPAQRDCPLDYASSGHVDGDVRAHLAAGREHRVDDVALEAIGQRALERRAVVGWP